MTDGDWERIAAIAARRWRGHRDYEDLRQAALIAVWRAGDRPHHHLQHMANNAVIDEIRRLRGRDDSRAGRRRRGEQLYGNVHEHLTPTLDIDRLRPSFTLGLRGRTAELADMLAAGCTKREIAARFDVTPSAVSHMLNGVRRDVARALR